MRWFAYPQNNSGNTWLPPAKIVLIEAPSADAADEVMKARFGIDVWNWEDDYECECCGERWSAADEWDEYQTYEDAMRNAGCDPDNPPMSEYGRRFSGVTPFGRVEGVIVVPWTDEGGGK